MCNGASEQAADVSGLLRAAQPTAAEIEARRAERSANEAYGHAVDTISRFGTTEDKMQMAIVLRAKAAEILVRAPK